MGEAARRGRPYFLYEILRAGRCVYVGATRCPDRRLKDSCKHAGGDSSRILVKGERTYVLNLERALITSRRPEINRHNGGQWTPGVPGNTHASLPMSDEHKEKISRGNRGKKRSPEQRKRMSEGIKRGWVKRRAAGRMGWDDARKLSHSESTRARARHSDGKFT